MSTRRKFLTESGVMALGSILFSERMAVADDAITTEEQKGDPDVPYEEVAYSPIFMQRLVSSSKKAQFGSWSKAFPERFISAAQKFVGVNRSDNQNQISDFLALFNLPFSNSHGPNAFCASGLGYAAATAYADILNLPHTQATQLKVFRDLMPDIDHWYYYPSPSCIDMYYVAKGKRRWIDNDPHGVAPRKGWIVLYDWKQNGGADHCGIVLNATTTSLETIEFNTSGKVNGNQVNGGVVAQRQRTLNGQVKGFIVTDIIPQ